jgi:hypothetical protein
MIEMTKAEALNQITIPDLTGTDAQISYGNKFRNLHIEMGVNYACTAKNDETTAKFIGGLNRTLATCTDSKFWIENKMDMANDDYFATYHKAFQVYKANKNK